MKGMHIARRLSVITAILMLGILATASVLAARSIRISTNNLLDTKIEQQSGRISGMVEEMQREALQVATVFANLDAVRAAYQVQDPEQGLAVLRAEVDPIVARLGASIGLDGTYQVHFHRAPAVSFYRSWSDRRGDDLSSFRATVLEVARTQEPLGAVELGRAGFVIRGIAPILDGARYLGSVEVFYRPDRILEIYGDDAGAGMVIMVESDAAAAIATQGGADDQFLARIGDSFVSTVTHDWIDLEQAIDAEQLQVSAANATATTSSAGRFLSSYIPILDFEGTAVGHLVLVTDTAGIQSDARGQMIRLTLLVLSLVFVGALIMVVVARRTVAAPLNETADRLKDISSGDGDLTQRLPEGRADEFGRLSRHFNSFAEQLQAMMGATQDATRQLAVGAEELEKGSEHTQLSARAIAGLVQRVAEQIEEQDGSIGQSSASVEQISGNISSLVRSVASLSTNIDDSAASVEEMTANVASIARNLERVDASVDQLVAESGKGRDTMKAVTGRMQEAVEQSENLQAANRLIAALSAQTNLLAMNAAIEAAHAGEYGRGFAVVAEEIRNLAENAATQSKVIGTELKKTQELISGANEAAAQADNAFGTMQETVDVVNELEQSVRNALREQEAGNSAVLGSLDQMKSLGAEVNAGISEIESGAGAILQEMTTLSQVSRQATALVTEIRKSTVEIESSMDGVAGQSKQNRSLVEKVQQYAGRFRVGD